MMIKMEFTPKSLTFAHDDGYFKSEIIGPRENKPYIVFHQSLILDAESTETLKSFLKGIKKLDVRVGMAEEGEGPYFVQFIGFTTDCDDNYESDCDYPPIIWTMPNAAKTNS